MQAYGSDRLRQDGNRWILSTRLEKGWTPRAEKSSTFAEHPGTAILCDDEYFEVVKVEAIPNGVRYILEPWADHHAIRTSERYDAESEAARLSNRQADLGHIRTRRTLNLLGIFVGHLPADVQEKIGNDYGIFAHWLTLMSTAPLYALAVGLFMLAGDKIMQGEMPAWLMIGAVALFGETLLRSMWAFFARKPMGSLVGLISYTIYAAATGTLVVSKPFPTTVAPDDIAMQDAISVREPFITLLPRADQQRIGQRLPYHYQHLSAKVAVVVLVFATLGSVSAAREGHVAGTLFAGFFVAEQIYRLSEFRRGPAGSVLGYAVRPFVRKLL